MTLVLVPVPSEMVEGTAGHWVPLVERLSHRAKETPEALVRQVMSGAIHLVLAWNPEAQKAEAMAGLMFRQRANGLWADVVWFSGPPRQVWLPLLPELERYVQEHCGCVGIRVTPHPGWAKTFEPLGYKTTHYIMERAF